MRSMPLLSLLALLLSCGIAVAEDLPTTPVARAALVPTDWQVEAEASGDLDADGRLDLAMVLVREGVDLSIKDKTAVGPRRLVIAFGTEDGFERVINNNQLIPPADDPELEDVFDDLKIAEGNLVLDLRLFALQVAGACGERVSPSNGRAVLSPLSCSIGPMSIAAPVSSP